MADGKTIWRPWTVFVWGGDKYTIINNKQTIKSN